MAEVDVEDLERVQETVEDVDDLLQEALQCAETYTSAEDVRPSALRAFDRVNEARKRLDDIDERDFSEGTKDD